MLDIFLRTVAVANSRGEFVSDDDLARLSKFSRESDKRLFIIEAIAGNIKTIIASSVRALFQEEPHLIDPGGSAYTNRQLAACLRDLEIILRYVTYAFIAGDDDVLRERCLNGLRETYQALGVPGNSVANAIQKIRDNTISIIRNSPEFDENNEEFLSELTAYFDLSASEVMMSYFYPQVVERGFQEEIHEYLIAISLGLDTKTIKLHRFIPAQIYLPITEQSQITRLFKIVDDVISAFGFETVYEFPSETGSWIKRILVGTKDTLNQPEIKDRLKKIERAVELQGLQKTQSEIDKNQAEAVSKLMDSLNKVEDGGVLFIGSVLIVKRRNSPVVAYTLTPEQLIYLQQNPHLVNDPVKVIETLSHSLTPGPFHSQGRLKMLEF